jgi:ribosomal protein S18 acetylase RimI-like enzyme
MDTGNKTASRHCRLLSDDHYDELYTTFLSAFANYYLPFDLTEVQFGNHLLLNGVDLTRTIGCFDKGKLIGFSLNGFGEWRGKQTIYDAGTGVLPAHRRTGVAGSMFAMMERSFASTGFEQILLEVLVQNTEAISLYRKLGFDVVRELAVLECAGTLNVSATPSDIEFRGISDPEWNELGKIADGSASWQNSSAAIARTSHLKTIIGAYDHDRLVGFVAFSARVGRIAQIAVLPDYSGRGIARRFLNIVRERAQSDMPLQVINAPREIGSAQRFFRKAGFHETILQYEMIKKF